MGYFNRKEQLKFTLHTIKKTKYENIEIIIVDDASDLEHRVIDFIDDIKGNLDIRVITIKKEEKTWLNPCIAYNKGFAAATGDIFIIQNPEVCHIGDCINYVAKNLEIGDWLTLNCYGSPNFNFNKQIETCQDISAIYNLIEENDRLISNVNPQLVYCSSSLVNGNKGKFFNHYDRAFVAYHYFGAIHKSDLYAKMDGGFNEKFKDCIGGEDDEFVKRLIYNKFKFKINIFNEKEPFVIHLFHDKPKHFDNYDYNKTISVFRETCIKFNMVPQNNIFMAPFYETPAGNRVLI